MQKLICLLTFIMAGGCWSRSTLTPTNRTEVENARREISAEGRDYLVRVYSDKASWKRILSNISTADMDWLVVAGQLYRYSDAGSSEQIRLAIGEGLKNNPENIFEFVNQDKTIPVEEICSAIDIDDPRFDGSDLAMLEIEKRKSAILALQERGDMDTKATCLRTLDAAKIQIRGFYKN